RGDRVERVLEVAERQRRRVAVDRQRAMVASVQQLVEAVRKPVPEIRAPLRDEDEARGYLLEEHPRLRGRVGDRGTGRPERPDLLDLVEKEAAVELRRGPGGKRRAEPSLDLARPGRLRHDRDSHGLHWIGGHEAGAHRGWPE